jgi:hypothetical protein
MNTDAVSGIELFPVPILKYRREDHESVRLMLIDLLNHLEQESKNIELPRYFIPQNIINNNIEIKNFMLWLEGCANNYANNILGITNNNFIYTNVWLNVNTNSKESIHHHDNSI